MALDKAHEILINKDMKKVITRPSKEYIQQMAGYHQHRASCLLNLAQVLSSTSETSYKNYTKDKVNIQSMLQDISDKNLLPTTNTTTTTLRNSFTGQVATGEEHQHLQTFRTVGQEEYNNHVKHTYIKKNSTKIVARRQRLKTFTKPKANKPRQRERQKDLLCLAKITVGCYFIYSV